MRRLGAMAVLVGNGVLLVATSAPMSGASHSAPLPEVVALDPTTPDLAIEADYFYRPDSDDRTSPSVSVRLVGDSLSGATGELQLFVVDPDTGDKRELGAVPVSAGLGEPLPVDLTVGGSVPLERGDHTLHLLLHLDGDAEIVADGTLTLGATIGRDRTDLVLRLGEVR